VLAAVTSRLHVTILCGSGCAGARDELLALGERLKMPTVQELPSKENVE
jgi:pyruvate dehydrogenase (quinone)